MARSSTTRKPGDPALPGAGRRPEVAHVRDLARKHTEAAVRTLAEIMCDANEKGAARVAAAQALLDRGYGRPTQPLEHGGPDGVPLGVVVQFIGPGNG